MFFHSFKLFAATSLTTLLLSACGGSGDAPPTPTGLRVTATAESSVTLEWDVIRGVEYWVLYGPTSIAPTDVSSILGWIGLPGGSQILDLTTSPRVITGLVNGTDYSFTVNGHTDGPGSPGATPVTAAPRLAGATWTAGMAITNAPALRAVAHRATVATITTASVSTYVAGGSGGAMFSSNDGASWTSIAPITSNTLNGASYGGGSYKLVGDAGVVLTSSDAVTWNARSSGTTNNLHAVAHNPSGVSVAVGAAGTIIYSGDGTTWATASTVPTTSDLYAVTYSSFNVGTNTAGTWVAVGAGGTMVQSADGITWTTVATGITTDLRGIASGITKAATATAASETTFVAVGANGASGSLFTSTDGITWAAPTPSVTGNNLNAVTFGTQFIAAGAGGNIFYSTDGITWAPATSNTTNDLFAVVRGTLAYSAVGAAGTNLFAK